MRILSLLLLLAPVACADVPAEAPAAVAPDTTLVVSSDPELRALAGELLPGLAARSGMALGEPVRIERRSRAELETYLRAKLDDELPPDRLRNLARGYELLGLVPEGTDLRSVLLDVYREQVAGFYDPDSTALFVMDDQPAEALEPVLLHELVHAVQDQTVSLEELTDPSLGNDRRTAAQAAIEGHATLVMLEYMMGRAGDDDIDLSTVPAMADQLRPALEAARDQYPALAAAPRVLQEGLLFPYLHGAGYVLAAWRESDDRGAALQEHLPLSTEQVMNPVRALGEPVDTPLEVTISAADGEIALAETLGMAELEILLEERVGSPDAAAGWGGDRWVLTRSREGEAEGLAYAVAFDDADARDRFIETMRPALGGFPEGGGRLRSLEFEGVPLALLTVGDEVALTVEVTAGGEGAER